LQLNEIWFAKASRGDQEELSVDFALQKQFFGHSNIVAEPESKRHCHHIGLSAC
jgi:hypothetical protein